MAGQLLPPPELAPPVPEHLTPQQCIVLWMDLFNAGEKLLLAGLRREIGPEGDLEEAYRRWYRDYLDQHDQALFRWMENLNRCEGKRVR